MAPVDEDRMMSAAKAAIAEERMSQLQHVSRQDRRTGYLRTVNPLRLQPTRVRRFYRGGAAIGRLRGVAEEDGFFPEDWLGSVIDASGSDGGGLSRLEDGRLLRDAIGADPMGWLGEGHVASFGTSTGLLVKLLDA